MFCIFILIDKTAIYMQDDVLIQKIELQILFNETIEKIF